MFDAYPHITLHAIVVAKIALSEEEDTTIEFCIPGDLGRVLEKRPGFGLTVMFERTGLITDVEADQVAVLEPAPLVSYQRN